MRLVFACTRTVGGVVGAGADALAPFVVPLSRVALVVAVCATPSSGAASGEVLANSLVLRLGVAGSGDICAADASRAPLPFGINATCMVSPPVCDVRSGTCATLQGATVDTRATPGLAAFSQLVISGAPSQLYTLSAYCTLGVSTTVGVAGTIAVPVYNGNNLSMAAGVGGTTVAAENVTLAGCASGQGPASTGTSRICSLCPTNTYSQGGGQPSCSTCPVTRVASGASCSGGIISTVDNFYRVVSLAQPDALQQRDTRIVSATTVLLPCPFPGSCNHAVTPLGALDPPAFTYSCALGYGGFLCGALCALK